MGNFKSSNPSANFIIEVIKTLDQDDLITIAEAVTERLEEDTVIDIKPTPQPIPDPKEPKNDIDAANPLASLMNTDTLGTLLQLLVQPRKAEPVAPQAFGPNLGNLSLLSNLPKLLQIGTELFQNQSREDRLIEAIVPFMPSRHQKSLFTIQRYLKIFSMVRSVPAILSNFKSK